MLPAPFPVPGRIFTPACDPLPVLGVGLRYHSRFRRDILSRVVPADFLEIEVDQFLDAPKRQQEELAEISQQFRVIPRAAHLSLGSADGLDEDYLDKLARFIDRVRPPWWCEHLAFSRAGTIHMGTPVPLPRVPACLRVLVRNVERVRQRIDAPLILENVTSIVDLPGNVMTEVEFLTEALERTHCGLLLDVANLHVNAINHGLDTSRLLQQLPLHRVVQLHVAGGHWDHGLLLDSHTQPVSPEVWGLVDEILARAPVAGIVVEREGDVDAVSELSGDILTARAAGRRHSRWA